MFGFRIVRLKKAPKLLLDRESGINSCATERPNYVERWEIDDIKARIGSLCRQVYGEDSLWDDPSRGTLYEKVAALTDGMEMKKVLVKKGGK